MNAPHNIIIALLFAAATTSFGCVAMQRAESDWPTGVPKGATVIGGGMFESLTLPSDGLLYVVDSETGNVLQTIQVTADKPIEVEMGQELMAVFLMNRYGMEETMRIMQNMESGSGFGDDEGEDEGDEDDEDDISDDAAAFVLYFIPMESLGLTP